MKEQYPKADYRAFEINYSSLPEENKKALKEELVVMAFELIVERHLWNPVFIIDFPLAVSPLTKIHRKQKRLVERFEPYIAGMELGNAYTELNDPLEQRKRLEAQERWSANLVSEGELQKEESSDANSSDAKEEEEDKKTGIDENFLHALEVGMPPTGGVGLGIERLVMILTDQKSIRDCILFPAQKKL